MFGIINLCIPYSPEPQILLHLLYTALQSETVDVTLVLCTASSSKEVNHALIALGHATGVRVVLAAPYAQTW